VCRTGVLSAAAHHRAPPSGFVLSVSGGTQAGFVVPGFGHGQHDVSEGEHVWG